MTTPRKITKKKAASGAQKSASTSYAGREIRVSSTQSGARVAIDGKELPCQRDDDTGAYFSVDVPYLRFGSLEEIARTAIDSEDTPY